jgi:hypothetical protein
MADGPTARDGNVFATRHAERCDVIPEDDMKTLVDDASSVVTGNDEAEVNFPTTSPRVPTTWTYMTQYGQLDSWHGAGFDVAETGAWATTEEGRADVLDDLEEAYDSMEGLLTDEGDMLPTIDSANEWIVGGSQSATGEGDVGIQMLTDCDMIEDM